MHIRAERDDLADIFSRATRAVGVRTTVDALQGLLCDVTGSRLRVTGSDLEMTVRTSGEVEVLEEGRTVLPARLATEAIRKLPPGAVVIRTSEGQVEISGAGPSFRFRQYAVEDFPTIQAPEAGKGVGVAGEQLVRAIAQVGVAAAHDEARPVLTGVLFEASNDRLRLVATDTYRLAVRDLAGVGPVGSGLVPFRGLRELGRTVVAGTVDVAIGDREAAFASERGSLTVRLIEGAFPAYEKLIPERYPNRLQVGRQELLDAIDRASLVAEEHIPVRMEMGDDGVDLSVTRQEVGGTAERLSGSFTGDKLTIAFNPRYLADGVTAIEDEEVVIEVQDGLKAAVVKGATTEDFLYLLMPVRI